jgi:hypothetical protein
MGIITLLLLTTPEQNRMGRDQKQKNDKHAQEEQKSENKPVEKPENPAIAL